MDTLELLYRAADAVGAALPKRRTVLVVVGGTGAGKTTFCHRLEGLGFVTVYPGRVIRSLPTSELRKLTCQISTAVQASSLKDLGAISPVSTDGLVRKLIDARWGLADGKTIVIDGMPRSREQIDWLFERAQYRAYTPRAVLIEADRELRIGRVSKRNDVWDAVHAKARFTAEMAALKPLLDEIRRRFETVEIFNGTR